MILDLENIFMCHCSKSPE